VQPEAIEAEGLIGSTGTCAGGEPVPLENKLVLPPGEFLRYKVAWVASCVLYSKEKLLEVGGFSFWEDLPRYRKGEDVLVQNLLMHRYGGCGIVPSGAYYSQVQTTTFSPQGTVDADAFDDLLPELAERYAP
jgi:hypothetical protein